MGRLCGGAHEISGIKAPLFLSGGVGGGEVGVGWWGRGGGVGMVGWVVVGQWWCAGGRRVGQIWGAWCAGEISTSGKKLSV